MARLAFFFQHNQMEKDLGEEIQLHLDLKVQEKREAGLEEKEVQQAAISEFGVAPSDWLTFGCVAIVLCLVGFLACFLPPAHLAAQVEPRAALRRE